jgi:hypothetical protein
MGWYLDLGMGGVPVVKHDPPLRRNLSLAEVRVQEWPDCPVCGQRVRVASVPAGAGLGGDRDVYIPERAWCSRGDDIASALRGGGS